ncbi:hypothetical protein D8674_026807 [Pyrus ussuriensis x Pyrus communis]|uniref:Uncharacterized protein n=1 Tax=Pyrus ussuriensis x Pyrus communis TaxID=2448454 RepID=A0A5N5IAY3_9ROSA|nr:hypothetical protein D8674_026807 [Pyrus ussuriensis x Pyrus communis]
MASIFVKNQTQSLSSQNLESFLSRFALHVSPREIPWKHHACKRSCRPTHQQTPSESRRIQSRDTSGGAAVASGETSPQNHHHSLCSTQDTQSVLKFLASGRSNEAFRKRWSSNFAAVVCSVGSPFVLRLSKEEDGYFCLVRKRGKIVREVNYVDKWDGGLLCCIN